MAETKASVEFCYSKFSPEAATTKAPGTTRAPTTRAPKTNPPITTNAPKTRPPKTTRAPKTRPPKTTRAPKIRPPKTTRAPKTNPIKTQKPTSTRAQRTKPSISKPLVDKEFFVQISKPMVDRENFDVRHCAMAAGKISNQSPTMTKGFKIADKAELLKTKYDLNEVLAKSIMFYEAQRSRFACLVRINCVSFK
jgi:hypothetical protein